MSFLLVNYFTFLRRNRQYINSMCGRYALYDIGPLEAEYGLPDDYDGAPNYNVAPSQVMPVVTQDGPRMMRWGLIPRWAKDAKIGYTLINARAETIFDKPLWKSLIIKQRCLVPANGFYEWQKRADGKHPFFIHPVDQSMFMFAGVWETWRHNGVDAHTYSILTTTPSAEMAAIHDRMPVILEEGIHDAWLGGGEKEDIEALLMPYVDGALELFEVDTSVNVTKVNTGDLIKPLNSR